MKKFLLHSKFILPAALILLLIVAACDGTTDPQLRLTSVSGKIINEQGAPVKEAAVYAYSSENDLLSVDSSNADGVFTLENVPNDYESIIIKVMHPAYDGFEQVLTEIGMNEEKTRFLITLNSNDNCCGMINVNVKHGDSGEAIGGAEVRLNHGDKIIRKAMTNDDGNLSFDNICEGNYWLRIAKDGYRVVEKEFEIGECDTLDFTFEMFSGKDEDCCGAILVRAIDDRTREPLGNVDVRLNKGDDIIKKGRTDEKGKINFSNLCPGEYWLRLAIDGYKVIEEEFVIEECDTLDPVFNMQAMSGKDSCCDGKVYVAVKDEHSGERIPHAKVRLWKDGNKIAEVRTNADGIAIFKELCEGKYGVSILHERYKGMEFDFELGCNKTLEFHKELIPLDKDTCCDGKVYVAVKDEHSGERIPHAKVRLWKDGNKIAEKLTNADGIAVFEELCEGKYGVDIQHEHYKAIEFHLELGCSKTLEFHKELIPLDKDTCCDGKIYIAAEDKHTGDRIIHAKVRLWKDGNKIAEKLTNADGIAVFEELCEGKYGVDIQHEHYKAIEFHLELGCNKVVELHKALEPIGKDTCCDGVLYIIPKDKQSGELINGAKVKLWRNGQILETVVVRDGSAVFDGLCEGEYGVDIIHPDYKDIEFAVNLDCNERKEILKHLEKESAPCDDAAMKLIIKDKESGELIEGAFVAVKLNGKVIRDGRSNSDGIFVAEELTAPATYVVLIEKDRYNRVEFEFVFKECKTYQETVRLLKE